jgi:tetratricopeptide (TPR) repeat protein
MKRILAILCTVLTVVGAVTGLLAQSTTGERGGLTTGMATPTFKNIYALIVGISKYENREIRDLHFAGDDAKLFYTYLLAAYPNQAKPGNIHLLVDEQATGAEIERNLAWLRDQASENDLVVFFFAGHGGIDNIGINQGQAYLIPYKSSLASLNDSRAIKIAEVDDLMNNQISIGKKATTICILDACHAGNSTNNQQMAMDINKRLSQQQGNVIKILASRANQLANEDPLLCGGHGVFTYFLIKGLLKEADKNGDNRISLSEMNDFLPGKVREKTKERQDPMVQYQNDLSLNGWQGVSKEEFDCLLDQKPGTAKAIAYAEYDEKKLIAGHLNETQKRHYEQFTKALTDHRYLEPAGNSVLHYYNILRDDGVEPTVLNQIQSQWKAAFQDHAQGLILAYLEERPIQAYTEYEKAAQLVSRVLEASQPTDSDYKRIQARQIWLASYTESQKVGLGIYRNSQNERRKQRQLIISNVKRAIELDPEAAYLYNTLGYNLEKVEEKEQAKAAYRKAIELAPRWTYPRNNLGVVLNDREEKIKLYEECIRLNPEMELAYSNLAPQYLAQGDTLKCRQMLDKALVLCTREKSANYRLSLAWTYQQYAELYKKRDNRQLAEYYYKLAIENSDPNDIDSRLTLAEYYCELYETNKVDDILKGMMENWSKDARPYATLGYKYFQISDWDNAAHYYEQALNRDSLNAYYYASLADTYRNAKKYEKATGAINTAIQLDPSEETYLSTRGNVFEQQGLYDKAIIDHENALRINQKSHFSLASLGYVYLSKKDYVKAELYFRQALTLNNKEAYNFRALGYVFYLQKKYNEALAEYGKALKISPSNNDIWLNIADVYRVKNQLDSAVIALNQGVELSGYIKERKYKEAKQQFMQNIGRSDNVFSYYALGYLQEKGYGGSVNHLEAVRWYRYAAQMGSAVAAQRLIQLYQTHQVRIEKVDAEINRLRKNIDKGLKRFTIPATLADGNKTPVDLFISDFPSDPNEPIADELRRIREVRQATIAQEVTDSFGKLYDIAVKNNVSYQDLCVYALGAANNEKTRNASRAINYPAKALEAIGNNRLDSLNSYMRQAVISYLGVDLNDSEKSAQRLLDSLRSGTSQPGLFYYALGYLYEHKPSGRAWSKAENYYRYSFQTGYAPAYFRLLTRFIREIPSTSQANWLRDNYNRGFRGFLVTTYQPDSTSKKLNLYVHDFPQDANNPVMDERKRLQEIFGVTLSSSIVTRFADLYKDSQSNKRSFQQQVQLTVDTSSPNSASTESNEAVDKLIKQADKFYEDSKYKEAAPLYLKAIEQTKDKSLLTEYWVKLGNTMMFTKEHGMAQKCYKVSVSINPTAWAYYCSGYDYVMQTKFDSAAIRYKQAIELNPSRATYHLELGRVYYEQKDYQAAIRTLTRARQLDSTNTQTLNTLGISLTYAKRYAEGLSIFKKAIELNPSSTGVYIYNIACNYALQGKNTEALNNLEEALKRKYSNYEDIIKDSDFALLKSTEGFKQLMAKYFPGRK